jgi:hypothetical protein
MRQLDEIAVSVPVAGSWTDNRTATLAITAVGQHAPAFMPQWTCVRVTTTCSLLMVYVPPMRAGTAPRPQIGNTFTTGWIPRATYQAMMVTCLETVNFKENPPMYVIEYYGHVNTA